MKAPGKPLEEVSVIGIASVFTPDQNRRKGYAGSMMRLMSERIREGAGGRGFSVLYSDVGTEFYAKNGGWKIGDESELVISCIHDFEEALPLEMLTLEQAKDCIEADVELIKKELVGETDLTVIQMVPQHVELEWATTRDQYGARYLNVKETEHVGAKVCSGDGWGYVLWFHEYKESTLIALRLREPPTDAGLRSLIQVLVTEARRSGLKHVAVWSPSERLEKVSGIKKSTRNSSLPAVLYLGDDSIHWRTPEKLGWC